jgi:hypothetical protein
MPAPPPAAVHAGARDASPHASYPRLALPYGTAATGAAGSPALLHHHRHAYAPVIYPYDGEPPLLAAPHGPWAYAGYEPAGACYGRLEPAHEAPSDA